MIQTSSVEKVEAWIYAICLLFSIPPFFFWSVSSPYFMMVCLLISLKHFRINRDTGYVVFTTLLFLIYLVLAFMYFCGNCRYEFDGNRFLYRPSVFEIGV